MRFDRRHDEPQAEDPRVLALERQPREGDPERDKPIDLPVIEKGAQLVGQERVDQFASTDPCGDDRRCQGTCREDGKRLGWGKLRQPLQEDQDPEGIEEVG